LSGTERVRPPAIRARSVGRPRSTPPTPIARGQARVSMTTLSLRIVPHSRPESKISSARNAPLSS
jgi:hypothetical protein